MKTWPLLLIVSFAFALASTPTDPFAGNYQLSADGRDEIIGFKCDQTSFSLNFYKYFKAGGMSRVDSLPLVSARTWALGPSGRDVALRGNVILEDMDDDGFDEIIACYNLDSNTIRIHAMKPDPQAMITGAQVTFLDSGFLSITDPPIYNFLRNNTLGIKLSDPTQWFSAADFDADGQKEFALVYWAKRPGLEPRLHIKLFEIDDSLHISVRASMDGPAVRQTFSLSGATIEINLYAAAAADTRGAKRAELLLVSNQTVNDTAWRLALTAYSLDAATDSLKEKGGRTLYSPKTKDDTLRAVRILSGRFNDSLQEAALVTFGTSLVPDSLIAIAAQSNDSFIQAGINRPGVLNDAIDIDGDGLRELFFSPFTFCRLTPSQSLAPLWKLNGPITPDLLLGFCNLIPDTGNRKTIEIVSIQIDPQSAEFKFFIFRALFDTNKRFVGLDTVKCVMNAPLVSGSIYRFGDLDGDLRLGAPRQMQVTQIVQPMVILNAPPIHFDMFDNVKYDVSNAYNGNTCAFSANYTKTSSQTTEVQTTFSKDWGVSGSVSTSHKLWAVKVKSHLTAKYGEKFSKDSTASHSVTVGVSVDAKEDDRIFATVMDYRLWEYPVYCGGKFAGHVLVVDPMVTDKRWFPSKSWSGYSYQPLHEVGNILSYREYGDFAQNPLLDEKIKGDAASSFVLDANSSYDWTLKFSDFTSSSAKTEKEWGVEMGASVSAWGVEVGIEGSYNSQEISTQTTTVTSDLNLSAHFDKLDLSLGEVSYRVTPYAYWANNGALVVDYAAMPEISSGGGTPTWWQQRYSAKGDPCFILPWRYDPEKGFALQEAAKRQQTKDIQFFPKDPKSGDTITITARVHNFSLMQTPSPVAVRFWVGDPDSGGKAIVGTKGEQSVSTSSTLPARGMQTVSLRWIVPSDVGVFPRIYAIIDPSNTLGEVHEDNNKGWNILGKSSSVPFSRYRQGAGTFQMLTGDPMARTMRFNVPVKSSLSIELFDISGRRIAVLARGTYEPGTHRVEMKPMPSGIYLCKMVGRDMDGTTRVMAKTIGRLSPR